MNQDRKILAKQIVAEFLGTFFIIFFCTAPSGVFNPEKAHQDIPLLELALNTFFMVAGVSWMFSNISGSHFHTGISLGALFLKKISSLQFALYLLAQILGVVSADALIQLVERKNKAKQFFWFEQSWYEIIGWESLFSFSICLAYFLLNFNRKKERGMSAFAIGSLYATFIIAFLHQYYSRYNFIWCVMSALTSFTFMIELVWVLLGGVLGSLLATITFYYGFQDSSKKDVKELLIPDGVEI